MRYFLNIMGAIPIAGGAVSGAGSLWAEKEQQKLSVEFTNWAKLADAQLNRLGELIESLRNGPSGASFALVIAEIIGRIPSANEPVPVILNPITIDELQPYVAKGWLSLQSTGSLCSLACQNRVGNHIEDLKRPWGMGNGFVMTVISWDLPQE